MPVNYKPKPHTCAFVYELVDAQNSSIGSSMWGLDHGLTRTRRYKSKVS